MFSHLYWWWGVDWKLNSREIPSQSNPNYAKYAYCLSQNIISNFFFNLGEIWSGNVDDGFQFNLIEKELSLFKRQAPDLHDFDIF